jgi:HAMP domain-containing protein
MALPKRHWWRLADLPIYAKVSLAPSLILVVLLLLSFVSLRMLDAGKDRLDAISLRAFPTYQRAAETKDAVNAIQTALQHTLSVAANESDAARIRRVAIPVRAAITRAANAIDRLQQQIGPADGSVAASRKSFDAYQAAVTEVLNVVETDSATASMLMTDADDQFTKLSGELDGYKNRADNASQTLSQEAIHTAESERVLLLSGTGLAIVVSIGIMVVIARAIGRPVVGLTGTMASMANNDLDGVVPALGRGDEIGAMARAVDVFRRNGLQARHDAAERAGEQAAKQHRQAETGQHTANFGNSVTQRIGRRDATCRRRDGRSGDTGLWPGQRHRQKRRQGVDRSGLGRRGDRAAHLQRRRNFAPGVHRRPDRSASRAKRRNRPDDNA